MKEIEKAIEHLKECVMFRENFLKEKELMGTIVLDKEKILSSTILDKLSIKALEKQIPFKPYDEGYGWQCKCGTLLTMYEYMATKTLNDYCYCCGQKLNWGE